MRYAISDRNSARVGGYAAPVDQAAQLAAEGVDCFQLREKDMPAGELALLAGEVLQALTETTTRLLINGRVDVAIAVGAHGVHLSSALDELSADQVQRLYSAARRPPPVVTISCHTLEDILSVRKQPLTAILFGPVFGKTLEGSLVVKEAGLDLLQQACRVAAPVPVLALGGVTKKSIPSCLAVGAAGFAGIRLFQRAGSSKIHGMLSF